MKRYDLRHLKADFDDRMKEIVTKEITPGEGQLKYLYARKTVHAF